MRGSDPDASLYWLARMLAGGEDPLYIARRLVRMAVEDIGLADPNALVQAIAAKDTYDFLGSPRRRACPCPGHHLSRHRAEIERRLCRLRHRLARGGPRAARSCPPKHILNAPTKLMKQEGYGSGYAYDHNEDEAFSGQNYFPDGMERQTFYAPTTYGYEAEVKQRLDRWAKLRRERESRTTRD